MTGIQWTNKTWNPTVGCTRVSPGCDHCYAFDLHDRRHLAWKRGRWPTAPTQYHKPFSTVQLLPERLERPLHWTEPQMVFVDSMADLWHPDVPIDYVMDIYAVMAATPHHRYQVLTKRPLRRREALSSSDFRGEVARRAAYEWAAPGVWGTDPEAMPWPLPNVWELVSAEDQRRAEERIWELLNTPAAVRGVSAEPLLGPVDLETLVGPAGRSCYPLDAAKTAMTITRYVDAPQSQLDWVICGGESGPGARPCDVEWIRLIVRQCQAAGVAVFVKQDSGPRSGMYDHLPDDIKVREWPEEVTT